MYNNSKSGLQIFAWLWFTGFVLVSFLHEVNAFRNFQGVCIYNRAVHWTNNISHQAIIFNFVDVKIFENFLLNFPKFFILFLKLPSYIFQYVFGLMHSLIYCLFTVKIWNKIKLLLLRYVLNRIACFSSYLPLWLVAMVIFKKKYMYN